MMSDTEISLAPTNSIVFIVDPTHRYEVPADTGSALITATRSCIGVGTLAEMDGDTTIRLSNLFAAPEGELAFDGTIETPGLRISVIDSECNVLLTAQVENAVTSLKIWVNDPSEPDIISVQAR